MRAPDAVRRTKGLNCVVFGQPDTRARLRADATYASRLMNLADASLVVAAETLRLCNIFTLDRDDFDVYRIKRGHRQYLFQVMQ